MQNNVGTKLGMIKNKFYAGEISRENYWDLMRDKHLLLRDYHELLRDSDVDSIKLTSNSLLIELRNGAKFNWEPEEVRGSANVLVNDGTNEEGYSDMLFAAATGKSTIFDIGANVGYYCVQLPKLLGRFGQVHAFEPISSTYRQLINNIFLNGVESQVTSNNIGLSDMRGEVEFFLPDYSGSVAASMRNLHVDENSSKNYAAVDTMDNYCRLNSISSVDLIKIDVEGAELLVLRGGLEIIKTTRPILFMELLRKWSKPFGYHPNDVLRLLYDIGYKCWVLEDSNLAPFKWMDDLTLQTNFIFVHEDSDEDPRKWLKLKGCN